MRAATWLLDAWVRDFAQVLEMMTGQSCRIGWSAAASLPDDTTVWWRQSFSVCPEAPLFAGASARAWSDLGALALRAAGVELFEQSEAKSTYLEIIRQTMSSVASAIGSRLQKSIEATEGTVLSSPRPGQAVLIDVSGEGIDTELWLLLTSDFLSAIESPAAVAQSAPVQGATTSDVPAANQKTMEFLLDVELPVSLSFGNATMPLKDVLKLTTGAVVELDRHPDEPVDVIVNNTVIARGEVVVVEGNYGVRISQIINRQQRLALRGGERPPALR
jgi:flagellar motor switch protein FliN/FliY